MGVVFTVGDDVEGLLIPYIHTLKPDIAAKDIKDKYLAASLGKNSSQEFWLLLGFDKADIPVIERNYLERSFTLDAGFLPCIKRNVEYAFEESLIRHSSSRSFHYYT